MEPIKIQMKLVRANHWGPISGNRGITFRFQEWEYRHEATLMLEVDGQPNPDAHKSPLYALQGVPVGDMVEAEFQPYQDRRQESRENSRDSVKDVLGLRLSSVRPSEIPAQPSTNGNGVDLKKKTSIAGPPS